MMFIVYSVDPFKQMTGGTKRACSRHESMIGSRILSLGPSEDLWYVNLYPGTQVSATLYASSPSHNCAQYVHLNSTVSHVKSGLVICATKPVTPRVEKRS